MTITQHPHVSQVRRWMIRQHEVYDVNLYDIAAVAGVHADTVRGLINGRVTNPSSRIWDKLERVYLRYGETPILCTEQVQDRHAHNVAGFESWLSRRRKRLPELEMTEKEAA